MAEYILVEDTGFVLQEDGSLILLESFGVNVAATSLGSIVATLTPPSYVGTFINVQVTGLALTSSFGTASAEYDITFNVTTMGEIVSDWGNEQLITRIVAEVTSLGDISVGFGTAIFKRVWIEIPQSDPRGWNRIPTPVQ